MWDTRYRPLNFRDVLGQEGPIEVFKSRLSKGTALDTSYIFSGGAGRGKTTLARIWSRAMLCQNLTSDQEPCNECDNCQASLGDDSAAITEMDAASRGTMEHVRAIVDTLPFMVVGAPKKIYIIDECHRMSKDSQDVLLKPIEEKRMVAVFCTTATEKIQGTIKTRCEEHQIRSVTKEDILKRLKYILAAEKVTAYEEDALVMIIDRSGGHVRDAINKLEMLSQLGPITVESVREYLNLNLVSKYYQILLALGDPAQSITLAEQVLDSTSAEELSEGLAEAAMNSFRLTHNMLADFSYIDRDLAAQVSAMYGTKVTHLAEYFLRSYRVSRTSVISDLVACQAGIPDKGVAISAPVLVQAPFTIQQAVSTALIPGPVKAATPIPTPTVVAPVKSIDPKLEMTEVERKALPSSMPRDNTQGTSAITTTLQVSHSTDYMPAKEFRSKLLRLMQFGKGSP